MFENETQKMTEEIFIRLISNPEFLKTLKTHPSITQEFGDGFGKASGNMKILVLEDLIEDIELAVMTYLCKNKRRNSIKRYSSEQIPFEDYFEDEIKVRIDDFWNGLL